MSEQCCNETWMEDAKLSTAQRKKLKGSTFCGPNRSFPVPDCAHVTAARRLIGRYKGPGSKAAILACVSRKAKQLGCSGKGKDNYTDEEIEQLIESEAFDSARELMAFLEYVDDNRTPDEEHLDALKSSACGLLDKIRARRLGDSYESQVDVYMGRSVNSIMDALSDEMDMLSTEVTKKK